MEGGGQILRNSMSFAALLSRPIRITNIRAKRTKPGLRAQHSKGIGLVNTIKGGVLTGNFVTSSTIEYEPQWTGSIANRPSVRSHYRCDIETAGSVSLLTQTALPLLLFHPTPCTLTLIGGTNASFAPQIDWFQLVLQPTLRRLAAIDVDIECERRGFFPRGGGVVKVHTKPIARCIRGFSLTSKGRAQRIVGRLVIGGPFQARNFSTDLANAIVDAAKGELARRFGRKMSVSIEERWEDSLSDGIGLVLALETTTHCLFGGSSLWAPSKRRNQRRDEFEGGDEFLEFSEMGRSAAKELISEWEGTRRGCTDRWLQDQLILFMALAEGKSTMATGALELHTETAIAIAQRFTGVEFAVRTEKDGTVFIECEGMGYRMESGNGKGVDEKEESGDDDDDGKEEEEVQESILLKATVSRAAKCKHRWCASREGHDPSMVNALRHVAVISHYDLFCLTWQSCATAVCVCVSIATV